MGAWTRVAVVALGLTLSGCDEGNIFQVTSRPGGGEMLLTVSNSTTPTYSWSGGRASSLSVRANTGETFWQIEALDANGFFPPVQHGVVPTGARVVIPSRPLVPGALHTAIVLGVSGGSGTRSFTPTPLTSP
jgi:hypothetical protein